jgi:hypothetical protein
MIDFGMAIPLAADEREETSPFGKEEYASFFSLVLSALVLDCFGFCLLLLVVIILRRWFKRMASCVRSLMYTRWPNP